MKYKKTAYSDSDVCSSDLSFDEYYNQNMNISKFHINVSDYNCEECDNRSEAIVNVRSNCSNTDRTLCNGNNICSSDSDECMKNGCSNKVNCSGYNSAEALKAKYKKIQKTVGVSSSEYAMNKS